VLTGKQEYVSMVNVIPLVPFFGGLKMHTNFPRFVSSLLVIFILSFLCAFFTMAFVDYLLTPSAIMTLFGTTTLGYGKAYWISFLAIYLTK
jgi:hypothetical protein